MVQDAVIRRSVVLEWGQSGNDPDEARWVSRAREGDDAAFGWLLSRYRQRVVRLAAHVMGRPGEAEDVAQEAFVRAFRAIRSFRGEGRFYTWLYHIVVRLCLDRKRLARWDAEIPEAIAFNADEPSTDRRDSADSTLMVQSLLASLSPPIRAALILRELEGLDYEEIGVVLDIPVGTVRSRLNAARSQFRALWMAAERETYRV